MVKRIQDVVSPATKKAMLTSDEMIAILYMRGITVPYIFGKFFEYEAHEAAHSDEVFGSSEEGQHGRAPLTVGDAKLAGADVPDQPLPRQPF